MAGTFDENETVLNWASLDPRRTERAIQTMLRRLYPGLRSFDGAGGDGGRDAELMTADGRTVFEVKSFGRLGSSQRRQIERSLRRAVESVADLSRWVLVIPMNMTPNRAGRSGEQAWFEDKLQSIAPDVDLAWWGLDWLDGQAADRADFVRYVEGPDSQLLERSRLFEKETAVLAGGVGDLRSRVENLRASVDDVSMFWTLDFASRNGVTTSTLRAKIPDAHLLDPITITPTFSFKVGDPEAEELREQFERTLAFGGTVDLPAGYVTSLDIDASDEARLLFSRDDPSASEYTLTTAREQLDRNIRCSYQVLDADDRVLGHFPVFLRERTGGARGATLYGSDAAGIATFEVGVPRCEKFPGPDEVRTMNDARLHVTLPDTLVGFDIDSLVPVVGAFAAAIEGTSIRFEMPGLGHIGGGPLTAAQFPAASETQRLVADLYRMQQHTESLLRFPANITNADVRDLHDFVRLLDGETVEHEGGLTLNLKPEAVGAFLETVNPADGEIVGAFMSMTDGLELEVGDLTLHYGHAAFYAPLARLVNRDELEAIAAADDILDGPVEARFEPTDEPFRWMPRERAIEYYEASPRTNQLGA